MQVDNDLAALHYCICFGSEFTLMSGSAIDPELLVGLSSGGRSNEEETQSTMTQS